MHLRILAVAMAVALVASLFVAVRPARAVPDAALAPPFSDHAVDSDQDGINEALVIVVPVHVTYPGDFSVQVGLAQQFYISTKVSLAAGSSDVSVRIPGAAIHQMSSDGPYNATITLFGIIWFGSVDYTTGAYARSSFQGADAAFSASPMDRGMDLDGDGQFEEIWVNASFTVTAAGTFGLASDLATDSEFVSGGDRVDMYLGPGTYRHTFRFPTALLNLSRENGGYSVELCLYQDFGETEIEADRVWWRTGYYPWTSLAGPRAALGTAFSQTPRDTDGDGFIDELLIHVPLVVSHPGPVEVEGALHTPKMWGIADQRNGPVNLSRGSQLWNLTFDTVALRSTQSDGPYNVTVYLSFPDVGGYMPTAYYNAPGYSWTQMRPVSATVDLSGISSRLVDANGDGRPELLHLDVPIDVQREGDYSLWSPYSSFSLLRHLPAGRTTVGVDVSGVYLARYGELPPWTFYLQLIRLDAGRQWDYNLVHWNTSLYQPTDFELLPSRTVNVSLRRASGGPVHMGVVLLEDPVRHDVQVSLVHNEDGNATFWMYPGNFTVASLETWPRTIPQSRQISVTANTTVTFTLASSPVDTVSWEVNLQSWNTTAVTGTLTLQESTLAARVLADAEGDLDGTANATELALYLQYGGFPYPSPLPEPDPDNYGLGITVDGHRQSVVSRGPPTVTGAGPDFGTAPVQASWDYAMSGDAASTGDPHTVTMDVPYDDGYLNYSVDLHLPAGYQGNLAVSGNLTATSTGVGSWRLDPGTRPNGASYNYAAVSVVTAASGGTGLDMALVTVLVGTCVAFAIVLVAIVWSRRKPRP